MTTKAKYNTVKVVDRKGNLYLDFRYKSDRFRPSLKMPNTSVNKLLAERIANQIELDIKTNQFDRTLISYFGSDDEKTQPRNKGDFTLVGMYRYWTDETGIATKDSEGVRRFIYRAAPNQDNLHACVKAQGWSVTTHNRYCKVLNQFLQFYNSECETTIKPLALLKGSKQTDPKRRPFTLSEMQAICTAFKDDSYCPKASAYKHSHYYSLVLFLFATGCRMGEIVGLKAKHFNLVNGTVEIAESLSPKSAYDSTRIQKSTKTGSVRVLPLPKFLLEHFSEVLAEKKKEEYVFTGPNGKPINQKNFTSRIWPVVIAGLRMEYRVPYAGRHTMASMAIEQGIPLTGIAYLMGHSDTTMVMKQYGHMINKPQLPTIELG